MTTRKHNSFRLRRLPEVSLLAIALSLPALPGNARAQALAELPDPRHQELYLEVTVNQVPAAALSRFVLSDGRLHASAATLRDLGVRWPGGDEAQGLVALDTLPGLQFDYDSSRQRVSLLVPVDLLDATPVRQGYAAPPPLLPDPSTRLPGLAVNYDLYGQTDRHALSASAWSELRLFGIGRGVFVSTGTLRAVRPDGARGHYDALRLDSSWEFDDPERMLTVTVGDTVTGALSWTRPTRIGGLRISRNFSLQPYRVTTPLASFAGEAVLPSTVDILINGIRQSSQQVQPGQFVIESAPLLSGAGNAQMVITDINGQRRVMDFPLYGTPQLLAAGLTDWSVELGAVRRGYGQDSFNYAGDPVLSATGRLGMSDRTTLEGHAEASPDLQMGGIGANWRLGDRGGLLTAAAAGSRSGSLRGTLARLGYQWSSPRFNLFASSTRRSAGFRDVASLETGAMPRRTDQAFVGFNTALGQFGGSYIVQSDQTDETRRYATLNWSRQLPRHSTLSMSVSRGLDDDTGTSAYLFWSMQLDRNTSVSATARRTNGRDSLAVGAHRSPHSDLGGWGWRTQAILGDRPGAQAELNRLGRHGQWAVGANHWQGDGGMPSTTTAYASASGGLALVRGHAYAMRRIHDAFAVVDTNGFADIPVRLENRVIGHTDDNGLLLVSRLNAWQANRLSIDPLDLPANTRLGDTTITAVPGRLSGMLAAFEVERIVSVELSLRDPLGEPLPAGSRVWLDRDDAIAGEPADTVVGHDGVVWLANPPPGARLHVVTAGGGSCSAELRGLDALDGTIHLEEVICR